MRIIKVCDTKQSIFRDKNVYTRIDNSCEFYTRKLTCERKKKRNENISTVPRKKYAHKNGIFKKCIYSLLPRDKKDSPPQTLPFPFKDKTKRAARYMIKYNFYLYFHRNTELKLKRKKI